MSAKTETIFDWKMPIRHDPNWQFWAFVEFKGHYNCEDVAGQMSQVYVEVSHVQGEACGIHKASN
jgi:hypothetical protein